MRGATRARSSQRAMRRSFRVWWEGVGCGFPLLAPVLIAVAYEKLAQNQETDWDFAQDVLVTHGPPGVLNTVTGVCGLAAMLWLYGVAWHQPMAESIAWARTTIAEAMPSASTLTGGLRRRRRPDHAASVAAVARADLRPARHRRRPPRIRASRARTRFRRRRRLAPRRPRSRRRSTSTSRHCSPSAARRSRWSASKARACCAPATGGARRSLCKAWTELELANADSYRCLGQALQAQGYHQDAIAAFRKAKQYDPNDRSLDAAIDRSQRGIVADFLNRYRR